MKISIVQILILLISFFLNCNLNNKKSLTKDKQTENEITKVIDYKVDSNNKLEFQSDQSASETTVPITLLKENPVKTLKNELNKEFSDSLNFLKESLEEENPKSINFDEFLKKIIEKNQKEKLKVVLKHVKQELDSCTGENETSGKTTYKTSLGNAYSGTNLEEDLNNLEKDQAMCKGF